MLSFIWGDFSDCLRPLMTTTLETHGDILRWTSHPQGQHELHHLKPTTLEKTNAGLTAVIKSYCKGLPESYTFEVLNKARAADPDGRAGRLQSMKYGAAMSHQVQAAKIADMTVDELLRQPEDVIEAWLTAGAVNRGYASFAVQAARHAGMTAAAFGDLDLHAQMKIVRAMAQGRGKKGGDKCETNRRKAYTARLRVDDWTALTAEQQGAAFLLSEFPYLQRGHVSQSSSAAALRATVGQLFTDYGMAFAHFILVCMPQLCRFEDNWAQKRRSIYGELTAQKPGGGVYQTQTLGVVCVLSWQSPSLESLLRTITLCPLAGRNMPM
jgi:hypothetical protein